MRIWSLAWGAVIGAVLGASIGWYSFYLLTGPMAKEDTRVGAWTTLNDIGEVKQNPYTRARVAIYGLWGLPPSEVIYFSALKDDSGNALDHRCLYEVKGTNPPARWWSIAAYRDGLYIENPDDRYSISQSTITQEQDGSWIVLLSPDGRGKNGLALGAKSGPIQLSYRLYQPNPGVAENRQEVAVPSIKKQRCPAA